MSSSLFGAANDHTGAFTSMFIFSWLGVPFCGRTPFGNQFFRIRASVCGCFRRLMYSSRAAVTASLFSAMLTQSLSLLNQAVVDVRLVGMDPRMYFSHGAVYAQAHCYLC